MPDSKYHVVSRPHRPGRLAAAPKGMALLAAAGALGIGALYAHFRARKAEARHPPKGRFLTVDGVKLRMIDEGRGDPVLLLHGNGALIEDMTSSGLVDELRRTSRVIVFDRPGFGYSERPRSHLWTPHAQAQLLNAALDQLGIGAVTVFGHSLGTQVAVEMALARPERVRKLVLASGYYYPSRRLDVLLQTPPALPVIGDLLRHTISPVLTELLLPRIYKTLFGPAPIAARFQAEFPHGLLLRPTQLRAAAADTAFLIPTAERLQHLYGTLSMPVAIVTGEADKVVDASANSQRLHSEVPGSRLTVVPGAGHMVHHTALRQVVGMVET